MLLFPTAPRDVLILGAGFSKALSETMPLTDELGDRIAERLLAGGEVRLDRRFQSGEFEAWLSRIAEDQPDLTAVENLKNRALFQACGESVASVLNESVGAAIDGLLLVPWLRRLLGTLHARQATVVTFNQDVLIEAAVKIHTWLGAWDRQRWDGYDQPMIDWPDVIDDRPTLSGLGRGTPQATFRLLKLHGSTNWYWHPGDFSGATTARWFLPGEAPSRVAVPDEETALKRRLPSRVPLIVPPTASKSLYYQVPLLSQLWQDAHAALSAPDVIVSFLGYSLPLTDLVTSGMLRETLSVQPGIEERVDVVNPKRADVLLHLQAIGITPWEDHVFDTVGDFTFEYEARAAREVTEALRTWEPDETECLLLVGTSKGSGAKVVDFHAEGKDLVVQLDDAQPPYASTNMPREGTLPRSLSDLLVAIQLTKPERLIADGPTGRTPIVGAHECFASPGAGNGRWQVLITSEPVLH